MIPLITGDYKTKNFAFPPRNQSPATKSEMQYCASVTEAMYALYMRDQCALKSSDMGYYDLITLFGQGRQPQSRYQSFLFGDDIGGSTSTTGDADEGFAATRSEARGGWGSVNWEITSFMPKIKAAIKGLFHDIEYDVVADNIDENSGAEKETKKWQSFVYAKDQQFIDAYKLRSGLPADQPQFVPESVEELELYAAAGGFKLNLSRVMEKLIQYSYQISNWDEMKDKIIDSLCDYGFVGLKDYYDPEDCLVKSRWVDIRGVIAQYSKTSDYNDCEYAGELVPMKLGKISAITGWEPERLQKIAKKYTNYPQNSGLNYEKGYDDFTVLCLDAAWLDEDKIYESVYRNENTGSVSIKELPYGTTNPSQTKRDSTRVTNVRRVYQCTWIVDTEYAFDFGLYANQPSPARIPFHFFDLKETPITQRLIPMLDGVQIGQLKFQNAQALAMDGGYALNVGMLRNLILGGDHLPEDKAIPFLKKTGFLLYQENQPGRQYGGGGVQPVIPIPSAILSKVQEALAILDYNLRMVEVVTGLNPVSLGETPNPQAPVGTTNVSVQTAQNMLKPLIMGYTKLKEKSGATICDMITLAIRNDEKAYKNYARIVGESDLELIKTAEASGVQYGISLEARPSQATKQIMVEMINVYAGMHRDGRPGLSPDQAMFCVEQLEAGANLKELRLQIGYQVKKSEEKLTAEKQMMTQQQIDGNNQLKQIENQGGMAKQQAQNQGQMAVDDNKYRNDASLEILKAKLLKGESPQLINGQWVWPDVAEAVQKMQQSMDGGGQPPAEPQPQIPL